MILLNRKSLVAVLVSTIMVLSAAGCKKKGNTDKLEVVVYTALDRQFSEPIFERFEAETGVHVLPKYDTESTKTIGLVNAIRAEKQRPRCDVFWNNEIVNTIRLKEEGLLTPFDVPASAPFPDDYKDPDGCWVGLAARARVLLVNTDLVKAADEPQSMYDLIKPEWKGKAGIAKPLFGTTATHVACLFTLLGKEKAEEFLLALQANDVQVMAGNSQCAKAVAAGRLHVALTDTDDAVVQINAGKPVRIAYLDAEPDQLGTLFIPNTLSIIKGGPNPAAARKLVDYLLSPAVETSLAQGPSAQIPLNPQVMVSAPVKGPTQVKAMVVDFAEAATSFEPAAEFVKQQFLK